MRAHIEQLFVKKNVSFIRLDKKLFIIGTYIQTLIFITYCI